MDFSVDSVESILVHVARGQLGLKGAQHHNFQILRDLVNNVHTFRVTFTPLPNVVSLAEARASRRRKRK